MQIIVANQKLSNVDKLEKIIAIAKSRTTGIQNSWSNSRFFSNKGRHSHIQELYQAFTLLDSVNNTQEFITKLEEISKIIEKDDFLRSSTTSDVTCCDKERRVLR
jgi:hypothetical protein